MKPGTHTRKVLLDSRKIGNIEKLLALATSSFLTKETNKRFYLSRDLDTLDPSQHEEYKFMVLGMPNVGKSTLINALRTIGIGRGESATEVGLVQLCLIRS